MVTPTAETRVEAHDGTALFTELARVVTALSGLERLRSFTLPYPCDAQLALDHTVLYCLARNRTPPKSVPELMSWCRVNTAGGDLFRVPPAFVTPEATLIDPVGMMPTRTCFELASFGPLGQVEQEAIGLLEALEARCGSVEMYDRCRRFVMEWPVISQSDRFRKQGSWKSAVWNRVKDLYEPVPKCLIHRRSLARCGTCGLPALPPGKPVADAQHWCESGNCPPGVPTRLVREPDSALLLRRSLRVFLALPGPTEQAALDELTRAHVGYEFVPGGLGTYRTDDIGGRTCFLRAYDRQQPALLAARITDSFVDLTGLAVAVVPRRLTDRPDYRTAFEAAMGADLRERVMLTSPEDLVSSMRATQKTPWKESENDHA
ncbi:hypothetical protein [Streptomyces chrestomyceticus]|uniref:pPIWI_RE_Y domain-containing protein n=1 Tax=Streptomyces chrestomyceticus TaxID=68185 RepID=UPI0033DC6AB7